jgi:hypothetical protein
MASGVAGPSTTGPRSGEREPDLGSFLPTSPPSKHKVSNGAKHLRITRMRNRLLGLISATISLAANGIVAGPTLLAQSTASSTKAAVQRTADGHPDLSGMFDVSTMTPLQRPAEFGNRRALTREEAAEMEQYEKQRQEKNAAPSSPNREAPPVGGDTSPTHSYLEALFRFGGGVVGGSTRSGSHRAIHLPSSTARNAHHSSSIRQTVTNLR